MMEVSSLIISIVIHTPVGPHEDELSTMTMPQAPGSVDLRRQTMLNVLRTQATPASSGSILPLTPVKPGLGSPPHKVRRTSGHSYGAPGISSTALVAEEIDVDVRDAPYDPYSFSYRAADRSIRICLLWYRMDPRTGGNFMFTCRISEKSITITFSLPPADADTIATLEESEGAHLNATEPKEITWSVELGDHLNCDTSRYFKKINEDHNMFGIIYTVKEWKPPPQEITL
jgi:hypothetical protein